MKRGNTLRFLITTHKHLEGARLSLSGQWCNIPYPCTESAAEAARKEANGRPLVIDRKDY